MQTTIGQLVARLFDDYLANYGDEKLAALATCATVNGFLVSGGQAPQAPARPEPPTSGYATCTRRES